MPRPLWPLLSLLAIGACATLPKEPRPDAMARLGETTRVGAFRVQPLSVEEDSRCPENARCIPAGRLIVRTAITDHGRRIVRDLELGKPDVSGLVLDGAEPGRLAGKTILPAAWRFHWSEVRP